jgi:hypothetical protein
LFTPKKATKAQAANNAPVAKRDAKESKAVIK